MNPNDIDRDNPSIWQHGKNCTETEDHIKWHESLDKLVACFIMKTDKLPSETSLMELMNWSFEQIKERNV